VYSSPFVILLAFVSHACQAEVEVEVGEVVEVVEKGEVDEPAEEALEGGGGQGRAAEVVVEEGGGGDEQGEKEEPRGRLEDSFDSSMSDNNDDDDDENADKASVEEQSYDSDVSYISSEVSALCKKAPKHTVHRQNTTCAALSLPPHRACTHPPLSSSLPSCPMLARQLK